MPFCVNCGSKVRETDNFCLRCGAKVLLPEKEDRGTPPRQEAWAAPETPVTVPGENAENQLLQESDIPGFGTPAVSLCDPVPEEEPVQQEQEAPGQSREGFWTDSPYARPQAGQEAPLREPRYVPPVSPVPVYDPADEDAVPHPPAGRVALFPRKPLPLGRRLLAAVLCLLLILFSFSGLVLGIARNGTSPEGLEALVEALDLSDIEAYPVILDANRGESVTKWLKRTMEDQNIALGTLTSRELEKYLDQEIKPFIAEKLGEFARDFHSGNMSASVTEKEVTRMLEKSADYLREKHGLVLSQEQWRQIAQWVGTFGLYELADMETLAWSLRDEGLTLARLVNSWVAVGVMGILALLCVFLLARTTGSTLRTLGNTGVALLLAGLLPTAALALVNLFPQTWNELMGGIELLSAVTGAVLNQGGMGILAVFGGGVLLLLIRWGLGAIRVSKKQK